MSIEDVIKWLLGGGGVAAVVALWTTRHKPKVDTASVTMAGQDSFINNLQEQLKDAHAATKDERARADACEADRRECNAKCDNLLRENGALRHQRDAIKSLYVATLHGFVAGTVPPWLQTPYDLHELLPPDALPQWTVRLADTGVPGTEVNTPAPDPSDDGQDLDPTKE